MNIRGLSDVCGKVLTENAPKQVDPAIHTMIKDHLQKYHLHSAAMLLATHLGDKEGEEHHTRASIAHHSSAHTLYKEHVDGDMNGYTELRKQVKSETWSKLDPDYFK